MSRSLTLHQVACAFDVTPRVVGEWALAGCPHARTPEGVLIFEEEPLLRWCEERGVRPRPVTLAVVVRRTTLLSTGRDVDEVTALTERLVAVRGVGLRQAQALQDFLRDVRADLDEDEEAAPAAADLGGQPVAAQGEADHDGAGEPDGECAP